MRPTFKDHDKPLLTVMLQCRNPDVAKEYIAGALEEGADAFGLQMEAMLPEYHNEETVKELITAMQGKPVYVTRYRPDKSSDAVDDMLGEELLKLADWGATLCDVMGDMYCKHPDEMTDDPVAIQKQMKLINQLHAKGAEVLMSTHLNKYATAERILEIGLEQQRRGADVVKIVSGAHSDEELLDNLRAILLLKKHLKVPFLFLAGNLIRRIGCSMGCCMYLCVYRHDEYSTKRQPELQKVKAIRDNMQIGEKL